MFYKALFIFPFVFFSLLAHAQEKDPPVKAKKDSLKAFYYIVKGDTIPRLSIDLEEVVLLNKLKFNSREDRRRYLILKRKTRKVYPYAFMAAERLRVMNKRLESIKSKRLKRKYTKRIQKFIAGEFSEKLKKFTRTEGQILIKLIHRQTGFTAFRLVKELRSGWRAFWYNATANLFDISLKMKYDPEMVKEDFIIEDILQRSFQDEILEQQSSAFPIDYLKLSDKWKGKASN